MNNLKKLNLIDLLKSLIKKGIPFLGICLGLQVLFSISEEDGLNEGLDLLKGKVVKLPEGVKVPHMGWNSLKKKDNKNILLKDVKDGDYFYFVHSYYAVPETKDVIVGKTDYGIDFASVICQENLMAVQFHPEKSSDRGLAILNNFGGICK